MQLKFKVTGLIASVLIISNSFGQVSNVANVQPLLTSFSFDKVYTNVQSEFYKLFSNAENVRWSTINKNYGVTFGIKDLRYRVLLNPKGDWYTKLLMARKNNYQM
ncbi:MAG TPA: hypothetical protein VM843_01190, partial [Flavisolibacter sp.]|nr:hypothetical protein [Flavisolibacter sp.]